MGNVWGRAGGALHSRFRPGQRVERCRDHQLEVAFGEDDVRVLPVEDFALLGDAEFAAEAIDRLCVDRPVSRAPAAAYGTSAAVEEAQGDAALASYFMQRAVRLPYLPGAGDHAAIFIGVGVADSNKDGGMITST